MVVRLKFKVWKLITLTLFYKTTLRLSFYNRNIVNAYCYSLPLRCINSIHSFSQKIQLPYQSILSDFYFIKKNCLSSLLLYSPLCIVNLCLQLCTLLFYVYTLELFFLLCTLKKTWSQRNIVTSCLHVILSQLLHASPNTVTSCIHLRILSLLLYKSKNIVNTPIYTSEYCHHSYIHLKYCHHSYIHLKILSLLLCTYQNIDTSCIHLRILTSVIYQYISGDCHHSNIHLRTLDIGTTPI